MAIPYPEGDVYFRRSALKLPQDDYKYDAEDEKAFYGHILVETVWNTYASGPSTQPSNSSMKPHPRSKLAKDQAGGFYMTTFGAWTTTHVMFGPNSDGSNIIETWSSPTTEITRRSETTTMAAKSRLSFARCP